jgi:hypothetical protein
VRATESDEPVNNKYENGKLIEVKWEITS